MSLEKEIENLTRLVQNKEFEYQRLISKPYTKSRAKQINDLHKECNDLWVEIRRLSLKELKDDKG